MGERPVPWTYRKASAKEKRAASPWAASAFRLCHEVDPGGYSLGGFVDRPVRGGTALSAHAVGRAVDWHPSSRAAGDAVADAFIGRDAQDVQLILWNGRQWGGRSGGGWRRFSGASGPHRDHLHIESRSAHWSDS